MVIPVAASSKFSRFESHDSDSEEEDEEDEDDEKGEEVDLLEKQIEQFLQGSDQDDSGNENGHSSADGDDSGGDSPVVKSETGHSVGESPHNPRSDGEDQCVGSEAVVVGSKAEVGSKAGVGSEAKVVGSEAEVVRNEAEVVRSEQNTDSAKCCDINSVKDPVIDSTEVVVRSRSPSRARSSSSSSSGSSSSSHSSGSSSSWSSSMSSGSRPESSGSRPQSVSPERHKRPVSRDMPKVSCDTKTVERTTAKGPPRPSGERRGRKSNWERGTDSRSVSLKVGGSRSPTYSNEMERPGGRHESKQATQPTREVTSRRHPKDRLGHRPTPVLDAPKDAREKLEDRKRKFASNQAIQPDKRGATIVLKSAVPSGKVATDKENRQSNIKQRLGSHSRKDDRTHTDGTNPGIAHTKPDPPVTTIKERLDSFKSDDLSDSSDSFSFSDSDSEDASSAPWRQKNTIERDETQINRERYIRRRNDRCIDAVLVAPPGGARVQELRHRGRRRHQTPPRGRHVKRHEGRAWTAHHGDSGSDGDRDRRSLRSVMSIVKKNTDSADSQAGSRSSR